MHPRSFNLVAALGLLTAAPVLAQQSAAVTVQPAAVEIRHHRHPIAVRVLGTTPDGYSVDLRGEAKITSADPKIAAVDADGWVRPTGTGSTTVTVEVAGKTTIIPVTVTLPAGEPPTSFRHEVMPVLTRAGCNAGACHGYSLGKNGFKLSLRGQDADPDYAAIVREFSGRRVNLTTPAASLLVTKARGEVPHEGGTRFTRGSLSDHILVSWVAAGCPDDRKDPAEVVAVRLVPDRLVLKPGQAHRLQLIAEYTDGTRRDVTRLGVFAANNDLYGTVSDDGLVVAGTAGETAIVGRFERTFAATGVTVIAPGGGFTPTPVPADHLIDRHVVEKLNRMKLAPSPPCTDEEYLRRVYLDVIGVQPKPDEVRAFLADADPAKRAKVVDGLFRRPEYVDHWSLKWGDLLQNSRNVVSQPAVYQFREFIRSAVAANTRLDQFARQLLTGRGGFPDDPASVYFAISKDTNDTVERATQVFCGVRMLCARCHPHPLENWTQADYYGLASFFNQVSTRQDPRFPTLGNTKVVAVNPAAGFATNPRTGRPQPPRFLGGEEPKLPPTADRRTAYAAWLTAPQNPFFARGLVNRYWSYFFHRGIVDPVDDLRSTNPPINPALLDALSADFVASGFDARHLIRRIVTSRTYQRSSVPTDSNRGDEQNFSRFIPRRVPAEALLDTLVQATGVPENVGGAPAGFRAAQLPDAAVGSAFLRLFGKPQRMDACECERDNSSNMLQALHFINGKSILGRVQNPNARPALLLKQKMTDEQLVTELYLWSLARNPTAKELKLGVEFVASHGPDRQAATQDLMWALLNSRDFLLVH
ncbi:MAG: DUF1553 domain-containing protein [Gemmataceae bacterium]|nr:DUF1553 domain-containing protein [Gemmataceae bacterium]